MNIIEEQRLKEQGCPNPTIYNDESEFQKVERGDFLEKYDKKGNLMRTAEKFSTGTWIVHCYSGKELQGEYTEEEFKTIRKYFNN